jgi:hypothetical protein
MDVVEVKLQFPVPLLLGWRQYLEVWTDVYPFSYFLLSFQQS